MSGEIYEISDSNSGTHLLWYDDFLVAVGRIAQLKRWRENHFFGDSITQGGGYINYFESYLLTRFPQKNFQIINHGISSETISGTTEEDHDPPRPWAHPRFERDITRWNPDIVISCFGMNDGNYYPFEPTRYKKYQIGYNRLIERVHQEAKARLIILTPPPYDPYRRKASDPEAKTFGYKFAAINYDTTLKNYSQWLLTLRKQNQPVVDLHSQMNAHLTQRRKETVSFHLAPDAVHPNATGHWLMAQFLLLGWNMPAEADRCQVDAAAAKANGGNVSDLKITEQGVSYKWSSKLPMPMDEKWDHKSIELEQVAERLNRYRLQVTGLKSEKYNFSANGTLMGVVSAIELEQGLNLLKYKQLPSVVASGKLLQLVKERRRLIYGDWRKTIAEQETSLKTAARVKEINVQINQLRKPQSINIELTAVK